ncbi:hypothetical protein ACFL1H_00030 [Nanoarchaeota archaeon]
MVDLMEDYDDVEKRETKSLIEFKTKFKKCKNLILLTKNTAKIDGEIKFIPLWKWVFNNKGL